MIDTIVLTGRPAAGKSEIIDYITNLDPGARDRLRLGPVQVIDDFPFLWEKFEEDRILASHNRPRIWTDADLYFTDDFFWTLMIEKINLAYRKEMARDPSFSSRTKIIEFSRGGPSGYRSALSTLCPEILDRARLLYVKVPYEVSEARNRRRARPGLEDSILHHSLPDEKIRHYYLVDDWDDLTSSRPSGTLEISSRRIPFAIFPNDPEVTDDPAKLGPTLEKALSGF
jgi:hypothetical protein